MPFAFRPTRIPDVVLVEPRVFGDERGWTMEAYKRSDFAKAGIPDDLVMSLHTMSRGRGVVRGLHYQRAPMAQGKLVRCTRGEIYDVAVDVRAGSPTRGQHAAERLSAENRRMLWIPPGFAHGFCTLAEENEVLYLMTAEYSPPHEAAIRWDDPDLAIPWPLAGAPVVSPKDASAPLFRDV
jgi:dTDP-4-dehydrorhamnose 3,5-epimerase